MNAKKILVCCLALLLCLGALISCKKQPEPLPEPETLERIPSLDPDKLTDYTADPETSLYLETLGNSFRNMPETAATAFKLVDSGVGWTVEKYLGTDADVRVPATVNGKPVIALANGAFVANKTVKRLYLPDSVTSIGTNLLTDCEVLAALRTPLLGANAEEKQYLGYLFGAARFEDNPRDVPATLKYLELGGTKTSLAAFALYECNDLELITLPACMTRLETYSLFACQRLLALNVDHLTQLDEHAMDSCSSLTRLEFGSSLFQIGLGALEGCTELRTLTVPFVGGSMTENTYLGYIFGARVSDFSAGYYPTYLTRVTVLAATRLDHYAFYQCKTLTELTLPDTVTTIGSRAFSGCLYLKTLSLPTSLTSIGENAFFGCRSLKRLDASQTALSSIGVNAFYYCDALSEVILPATVTTIPASCFASCAELETINLEGVTEIGANAFRGCPKLERESETA